MTSLPTAKILLFIALSLGPASPHTVFVTSNSDNYVWDQGTNGWALQTKGLPTDNWHYVGQQQALPLDGHDAYAITHHNFAQRDILDLDDGNQVIKQGDNVFYVVDPGAANQKVYTILYPQE